MKKFDLHELMEQDRSERQKVFCEAYFGGKEYISYVNDRPDSVKEVDVRLLAAHIFVDLSIYYAGDFELVSHRDIRIQLPCGKKFVVSVRQEQ